MQSNYPSSAPRAALGLAAVAMTALTLALFVVLPAGPGFIGIDPHTPGEMSAAKSSVDVGAEAVNVQPGRAAPELRETQHQHRKSGARRRSNA